jgi:YjzC-like protein
MKKIIVKPGQNAPKSGQYLEIGPRGGEKKEVTVPKGKIMPPTEKPNSHFELVDPTDNKSGK